MSETTGADITVCIPAYRSHAFIEKTLEAVSVQTYPNFRAVISLDGQNFVYVRNGNRVERRAVQIAADGADQIRIQSGLSEGENILVEGVLLIRQIEQGGGAQ